VLPQLYYPSQVHRLIAHTFSLYFLALCLASILSPEYVVRRNLLQLRRRQKTVESNLKDTIPGQFYAIVAPFRELQVLALVRPEENPAQRQPKHQGCCKQLLLNLRGQGAVVG
jgi:hypothetical protein